MTPTGSASSPARASIPVERYGTRLAAAQRLAARREVAALLIGVGADLRYLTGYAAMPLERLTMLVIPAVPAAGRPSSCRASRRSRPAAARRSSAASSTCAPGTRPSPPTASWRTSSATSRPRASAAGQEVAVSDTLWASHLLRLQEVLPAGFGSATAVLRELRMVKDAEEIALLREAAEAADRVVDAIAAGRLVGRTEADVAREVRERLVAEGHDTADFAIVGSGSELVVPASRGLRAGDRGRRADRARHRRAARRLWQ